MDSDATTNSHQCTRSAVKKIWGRYVEHRTAAMRTLSTGWEYVRLSIKPLGRFSTSFAFGDREKHYRLPLNNLRSVPEGYTNEQIYMVRLLRSLVCSDIRVQLLDGTTSNRDSWLAQICSFLIIWNLGLGVSRISISVPRMWSRPPRTGNSLDTSLGDRSDIRAMATPHLLVN